MELSIKELVTISGLISAAIWFYWTQKFKPRVEFDIDCKFFFPAGNSEAIIAEIRFIFKNKGFVQHTIKFLELSVHGLESEDIVKSNPDTQNVIFKEEIYKRRSVVPQDWYFWVRPNVDQVINKIILVNKKHTVIRAISGFSYQDSKKSKHTAQRLFQVPKNA